VDKLSSKEKIDAIAKCLGISIIDQKPVSTLQQINTTLKNQIDKLSPDYVSSSLWHENLTPDHKKILKEMNESLKRDYKGRKEVLLKRFETTAQTFLWDESLKAAGTDQELKKEVQQILSDHTPLATPEYELYDIITASPDLVHEFIAPSRANSKTGNEIREFVMNAKPPDRGGRHEFSREMDVPEFKDRHGAEHNPNSFKSNVAVPPPKSQPAANIPLTTITTSKEEVKPPHNDQRGGRGWSGNRGGRRGQRAQYVPVNQEERDESGPKRSSGYNSNRGGGE